MDFAPSALASWQGEEEKKEGIHQAQEDQTQEVEVKLAVLQFYKVYDLGKVQTLRKECHNTECGAGTFMASHFDRHYCGGD
ncbi:hypothetical protein CICLE_v10003180mg [Citrus x clementina]|uniref:Small ribosomal subunit protein eS31 domain-containing protein n=2 Tax=Citrus TaxID=2706 RepID=V4SDL5_CITCL|nr:hypothetical protein CICLE_v10003180mg [Citrus x clementina]GAY58643.1 hypothetical protein CUMW_188540 [Citrus unshiu]